MTNFPDVNGTIEFLENEDSTYTDVLYEFQQMTSFNRIIAVCKTKEDIKEYMKRLQAISEGLLNCIPKHDPKLKYFYYGAFYMQMKMLPDLFKHMEV